MARKRTTKTDVVSKDAVARLAEYWFRAELMHEFLHTVLGEYEGNIDRIYGNGFGWEFEAYLSYWLSGLFVVVEGFNKLKLRDSRVQKLFMAHLRHLKGLRHETYHFAVERGPSGGEIIQQLNWAEELHAAIGDHIREYIGQKAKMERAKKRKRPALKKV